jgi:tetratricopeptide (TPR) repeat protein
LRRLPEASHLEQKESTQVEPEHILAAKGLPVRAALKSKAAASVILRRLWNFMLEAKGLRQTPKVNYRINKLWRKQAGPGETKPAVGAGELVRDEQFYLEQIKKFPKDLENYNRLGQYYMEGKDYEEARNVYDYLTKHAPGNSDYWARFGYSSLRLSEFDDAVEAYEKAVTLDSSHPNRYYNLALSQIALQQWSEAITALNKALELEPQNIKYLQVLTDVYHKAGKPHKAREVSRKLSRLDSVGDSEKKTR